MRFNSKTLEQLRTEARELADMATSAPSTHFIDDDNLTRRINDARLELFDLILLARGHEDYVATVDITMVEDQESYDLPRDFYSLLGAMAAASTTSTWRRLEPYNMPARAQLLSSRGALCHYRYRLRNATLSILPVPTNSTDVVRLDYVSAPAELVSEGDIWDRGWDKWLTLRVAEDLATAEENYELVQVRVGQRKEIEQRLRQLASERDAARPIFIEDTRKDDVWGWNRSGPPPDGEVF